MLPKYLANTLHVEITLTCMWFSVNFRALSEKPEAKLLMNCGIQRCPAFPTFEHISVVTRTRRCAEESVIESWCAGMQWTPYRALWNFVLVIWSTSTTFTIRLRSRSHDLSHDICCKAQAGRFRKSDSIGIHYRVKSREHTRAECVSCSVTQLLLSVAD